MSEPFHDPRLKEAVKRLWNEPAAPTDLRRRIQRSLQPPSRPWVGYVLAAVVLLIFGIFTWTAPQSSLSPEYRLPQAVAADLIKTHDASCQDPNHILLCGVNGDDYPLISRTLHQDLGIAVIAQPLPGWKFQGAGECVVCGHSSGHLLYRSGTRWLSIFSIPTHDLGVGTQPQDYAQIDGSHRLAGFIQDGGLYCIVATSPDGSFTPADAIQIRNQLQQSFTQSTAAAQANPTQNLALEPIAQQCTHLHIKPTALPWAIYHTMPKFAVYTDLQSTLADAQFP